MDTGHIILYKNDLLLMFYDLKAALIDIQGSTDTVLVPIIL